MSFMENKTLQDKSSCLEDEPEEKFENLKKNVSEFVDIKAENILIPVMEESHEESSDEEENKDTAFDIKEESGCLEESEDLCEANQLDDQYETIVVKSYTAMKIEREPVENIKLFFKDSPLEFEKQTYHQQIFENIFSKNHHISIKDLQEMYLSQLHKAAQTDMFSCALCKYQTMSLTNLNCHLFVIHNGKMEVEMFKCKICSYEAIYKSHIRKHMGKHKTHLKKQSKVKHKTQKDLSKRFPCSMCNYWGSSEDKLKKHLSVHTNKFNCDLCSFESQDVEVLQKHKGTHKDGKKFMCYMCTYTVTNKATLGRHLMNIHKIANEASKRSKMCEYCSFSCSSRHQLKIHHLLHKPVSDLKEGELHKCTQCSYQTKYKSNMKKHLLMHKDPELICEICGFATRHKKSYEYHLITHKKLNEIEWFRCTICPYQARNKKLLQQHIRKGDHSGKRLKHVRNRDRLREAEEKGEPIEAVIQKYKIKRIAGVEIKRERIRKPKDPNKKRLRKKSAQNDYSMIQNETFKNFEFNDLAIVKNELGG